jgi:hypothetical protein
MKTRFLSAALFTLCISHTYALDIVLPDGYKYENIQIKEKTDLGIRVGHETGVSFIDYLSLSPQDQYTFGYDSAKYNFQKSALSMSQTSKPVAIYGYSTPRPTPAVTPRPSQSPDQTSRGYVSRSSSAYSSSPRTASSSGQCAATTKKGYRCSRKAGSGSSYCWQHSS